VFDPSMLATVAELEVPMVPMRICVVPRNDAIHDGVRRCRYQRRSVS
jgi:hypothetical protein